MPEAQPIADDAESAHVFVCYSHSPRDGTVVFAEMAALREAGITLWFDEGMDPGSEWPEELATAISTCKALLFFVSPASVASRNCRNEVQYARDHGKPIVAVYLEETELPPALQLTLATTHALTRYALNRDAYRTQLIAALKEEAAPSAPSPRRVTLTPRRRERLMWAGALFVLLTAAAGWFIQQDAKPTTQSRASFSLRLPDELDITPRVYFEMFYAPPLAISRDARHVVFSARDKVTGEYQLFWRAVDRFETVPLAGTEGGTAPFFSADGQWIGFVTGRVLKRTRLDSANAETIVDLPDEPGFGGATWGSDQTIVYAPSAVTGLYAIPATGGTPRQLSTPDARQGEFSHVMPQFLPSGDAVIFSVRMGLAPESSAVQVLNLTTGKRRTLIDEAIGAHYARGQLVYSGTGASTGSLWSAPFAPDNGQLLGEPHRALDAVAADLYGLGYFDLAATGSLVFIPPAAVRPRDELFWIERDGARVVLADTEQNYAIPAISPDGARIAATQVSEARTVTLWLLDAARGNSVRFVSGGHNTHAAIWTPDGASLVFTSDHDGPSNLYIKTVDGAAPIRRLTVSKQHQDAGSLSPDGALLTYAELHPETNWDLWVLEMTTGETHPLLRSAAEEIQPIIAPAGDLYAYTSNETGRREIYLEQFPGGGHKQRVSTDGGEDPLWSRDASTLYFRWQSAIYAAQVTRTEARVDADEPKQVYQGDFEGRTGYGKANWDITADGRILLTSRQSYTLAPQINVILGWL